MIMILMYLCIFGYLSNKKSIFRKRNTFFFTDEYDISLVSYLYNKIFIVLT